jgi:hypothetical protein
MPDLLPEPRWSSSPSRLPPTNKAPACDRYDKASIAPGFRLVDFLPPLPLTDKVLQSSPRSGKSVGNDDVDILVSAGVRRVVADRDIFGTRHGEKQPNAVIVAFVMASLFSGDDNASRCQTPTELLKLLKLFANAMLDGAAMFEMLKTDLDWRQHVSPALASLD